MKFSVDVLETQSEISTAGAFCILELSSACEALQQETWLGATLTLAAVTLCTSLLVSQSVFKISVRTPNPDRFPGKTQMREET